MASRGLRVRAPVSYNDKDSQMVPAWLRTIQPSATDEPTEKRKKPASKNKKNSKRTANNKENADGEAASLVAAGVVDTVKESTSKNEDESKTKKKASIKVTKGKKVVAARGRNAGLTVVPIEDDRDAKRKASKVNGKGPGTQGHSDVQLAGGISKRVDQKDAEVDVAGNRLEVTRKAGGPSRPVPGLPWVQQKNHSEDEDGTSGYTNEEKTPTPLLKKPGIKRKASPVRGQGQALEELLDRAKTIKGFQDTTQGEAELFQKRSHFEAANPGRMIPKREILRNVSPARNHGNFDFTEFERRYLAPPSPIGNLNIRLPDFDPKQIQQMKESMASLVDLCSKLEEENTALKDLKIREDIEQVIEMQNEKVREHGKAASEVAQHWKAEAERLAELLDKDQLQDVTQKLREAEAKISELEMEVHDLKISEIEKDSRIVELQKRNTFLEKYARVYPTSDKCVGTDPVAGVDAAIQVPHGVQKMQPRSMAPEGVPASSMYTYGAVDAAGPTWGVPRGQMENSFEMQPQITMPHAPTGSKKLSGTTTSISSWQKNPMFAPGTKESRSQPASRRVSAPPAPLLDPNGQPRQIDFYSGQAGNQRTGSQKLETVEEENPSRSLPQNVSSDEENLLKNLELEVETSQHGIIYSHPRTGFMFKLCPAEEDEDDDSGPTFDLEYVPLAWGTARNAIGNCDVLQDQLLERMAFMSQNKEFLLKQIGAALKRA